jgi:flagellar M-ring protein FliF
MEFLRKLTQQLRQLWQQMGKAQKIAAVLAVGASVALLGGVGYWTSQADYQVLCLGLTAEEAALVTNKLQEKGISFRLAAGGSTILVPADQVQQQRLTMVAEDLQTKGGPGFSILDQTSFGWSPFLQHVNYVRALQGELAKTIMQIDPVVSARVHISRPEPSPFLRDQKAPTASVTLKLRPGAKVNRSTSAAIIALVARSVEGLTRENIALIDASNNQLIEAGESEMGAMASRFEQNREFENHLANKAETMLAKVLGPGRAVVRVTADLNMKRIRETKELYLEGRVGKTETTRTTKKTLNTVNKTAATGTTSNLGKGGSAAGQPTGSDERDESTTLEYLVPKTLQEIEDKQGAVERLTVAAFVDLARPAESGGRADDKALDLAKVQDTIKRAIGFKTERGDEITVTEVRMPDPTVASSALDEEWTRQEQWQQTLALVRNGSIGVTALAGVLLVWILMRRRSAAPTATEQPAPTTAEDSMLLERVATAFQRNPQAIGDVLKKWLNEQEQPPRIAA